MNMELLTKKLFEQWMETILERLERQDEMLLALKVPEKREHMPDRIRLDRQDELLLAMKAEGKQPTITESIRLFDNQDLCMLLQISKRSLQRYRSTGALPYKILGKKTYYSEDDVLKFLSEHVKDFQKDDVEFYKARIHNFFNK